MPPLAAAARLVISTARQTSSILQISPPSIDAPVVWAALAAPRFFPAREVGGGGALGSPVGLGLAAAAGSGSHGPGGAVPVVVPQISGLNFSIQMPILALRAVSCCASTAIMTSRSWVRILDQ